VRGIAPAGRKRTSETGSPCRADTAALDGIDCRLRVGAAGARRRVSATSTRRWLAAFRYREGPSHIRAAPAVTPPWRWPRCPADSSYGRRWSPRSAMAAGDVQLAVEIHAQVPRSVARCRRRPAPSAWLPSVSGDCNLAPNVSRVFFRAVPSSPGRRLSPCNQTLADLTVGKLHAGVGVDDPRPQRLRATWPHDNVNDGIGGIGGDADRANPCPVAPGRGRPPTSQPRGRWSRSSSVALRDGRTKA